VLLSKAREGFLFHQQIGNYSPATLEWYAERLGALERFLSETAPAPQVEAITRNDLERFIAFLQSRESLWGTDRYHKPQNKKLSAFTVHGYVRALSAFFRWARQEQLISTNPMDGIRRPKLPKSIKPRFTEQEIKQLLDACNGGHPALAARNRAIILLLLDAGLRAGELCTLTMDRLDAGMRRAHLTGKGLKDRYAPIGARTRQALWQYINRYRPAPKEGDYVFLTLRGGPLDPNKLAHVLTKLGNRAGVKPCNPHRFRHTMARLYLRNGGDVFTLQQILGHEDLATTRIYVQLEREDVEETHERASPVDRLGL
jgi:integrase/recombinase XerD